MQLSKTATSSGWFVHVTMYLHVWTTYAWEIEDLLSKMLWSVQWSTTTLEFPLSLFLCNLVLFWCVYIHRIWPIPIWLVILLIPRRMRGHIRWSLHFTDTCTCTYSHTWGGYLECPCCLEGGIYFHYPLSYFISELLNGA